MGSSPGFGSNPNNLPDMMETPLPASARCLPLARQVEPQGYSRPPPVASSPPDRALFGLAFAVAPELLFLNRAA